MEDPAHVNRLFRRLGELFPDAAFGFHIHNLSGMATANILAALDAGVQWLEGAICGIGGGIAMPTKLGSVGNFPTEDLVTMLDEMGIETGIDPERAVAISREIAAAARHRSPEPPRQRRHPQIGHRTRHQQPPHEIFMKPIADITAVAACRSRHIAALSGKGRARTCRRDLHRSGGRGRSLAQAEGAGRCHRRAQSARLGAARRRRPRQRSFARHGAAATFSTSSRRARGSTTSCCRNANCLPTCTPSRS